MRLIQRACRRVGAGSDIERHDRHAGRVECSDAFGRRRIERQAHVDAEAIKQNAGRFQVGCIGRVRTQFDTRGARSLARTDSRGAAVVRWIVICHARTFEFRQSGERIAAVVAVPGERNDGAVRLIARDDCRDRDAGTVYQRRRAFAEQCGTVDDTHLGGCNR